MVDYLNSIEHLPQKIHGNDYWYISPLRDEKHPSFKVNRAKNVWHDHGIGKG
ncbi:MAG: CHC2 zinc finger domain-containing protein, partial [Casimicrobiaceae bacterium]